MFKIIIIIVIICFSKIPDIADEYKIDIIEQSRS